MSVPLSILIISSRQGSGVSRTGIGYVSISLVIYAINRNVCQKQARIKNNIFGYMNRARRNEQMQKEKKKKEQNEFTHWKSKAHGSSLKELRSPLAKKIATLKIRLILFLFHKQAEGKTRTGQKIASFRSILLIVSPWIHHSCGTQ